MATAAYVSNDRCYNDSTLVDASKRVIGEQSHAPEYANSAVLKLRIFRAYPVTRAVRRVKDPRYFISVLSAFNSGSLVARDDLNR